MVGFIEAQSFWAVTGSYYYDFICGLGDSFSDTTGDEK